jgi:hypothetical protein
MIRMVDYSQIPTIFEHVEELLCQQLNVPGVSDVKAEPLLPEPNCFNIEIDSEKLKIYSSPGFD